LLSSRVAARFVTGLDVLVAGHVDTLLLPLIDYGGKSLNVEALKVEGLTSTSESYCQRGFLGALV
jgi:hypothetical protein